jgi:ribosomal protein S25
MVEARKIAEEVKNIRVISIIFIIKRLKIERF